MKSDGGLELWLLSEAESEVLIRGLSVFAGGCFRGSGLFVEGDWWNFEVLNLLGRLVDKSLVIVEEQDGEIPLQVVGSGEAVFTGKDKERFRRDGTNT